MFQFQIPLTDWKQIKGWWKKIENKIQNDDSLKECVVCLNSKLFDIDLNVKPTSNNVEDISIDTLNHLMTEIDTEVKQSQTETKSEQNQENNDDIDNTPPRIMKFIQAPVMSLLIFFVFFVFWCVYEVACVWYCCFCDDNFA